MILKLGLGHTFLVYSCLSVSIIVATGINKSSPDQDPDMKRKPVNTFFVSKPGGSDIIYWDGIFLNRSYWDNLIKISCIKDSLKQMLSGLADIDEPQQDNESNEVPDSGEKKSFPQSRSKYRRVLHSNSDEDASPPSNAVNDSDVEMEDVDEGRKKSFLHENRITYSVYARGLYTVNLRDYCDLVYTENVLKGCSTGLT